MTAEIDFPHPTSARKTTSEKQEIRNRHDQYMSDTPIDSTHKKTRHTFVFPCKRGASKTVSFDERADVRRTRSTPAPPPVPDLSLFLDKSAISFITCQSELSCNQ